MELGKRAFIRLILHRPHDLPDRGEVGRPLATTREHAVDEEHVGSVARFEDAVGQAGRRDSIRVHYRRTA